MTAKTKELNVIFVGFCFNIALFWLFKQSHWSFAYTAWFLIMCFCEFYVCVFVMLFCLFFLVYLFVLLFSKESGTESSGQGGEKDMRGDWGEETVIRMHYMKFQ